MLFRSGLQTFTTAIYQQFELEFSNANAAMLSAVLLVMCLTLLWLELRVRGKGRHVRIGQGVALFAMPDQAAQLPGERPRPRLQRRGVHAALVHQPPAAYQHQRPVRELRPQAPARTARIHDGDDFDMFGKIEL